MRRTSRAVITSWLGSISRTSGHGFSCRGIWPSTRLQSLGAVFASYDAHIQLALPAHYSRAAPFDNVNFAEAHNRPARSAARCRARSKAIVRSHGVPPVRLPCPRLVSAICTMPNCSGSPPQICGRRTRAGITSPARGLGLIIPQKVLCHPAR